LEKEGNAVPLALKEGCVFKRKDGRWCGKYCENGKQVSVYAGSRVEAVGKVNEKVRLRDSNAESQNISRKIRLVEWVESWIETYKTRELKASSLLNIKTTLLAEANRQPFGRKMVGQIKADDVQRFLNGIITPTQRLKAFTNLRACLDVLVRNRTIKENPCSFIEPPKGKPKTEKASLSLVDQAIFFDRLKTVSPRYAPFVEFLAWTGLRKGEALALEWSDIDFDRATLFVSKAYDITTKTNTTPKTVKSKRVVPLFRRSMEILLSLKRKEGERVFWFIGRTANTHNFKTMAVLCGFPELTLHSFRHTFASRCREAEVDEKVVQKWLGHSKLDTTLNTYTHVFSDFEQSQTLKMAKISG